MRKAADESSVPWYGPGHNHSHSRNHHLKQHGSGGGGGGGYNNQHRRDNFGPAGWSGDGDDGVDRGTGRF